MSSISLETPPRERDILRRAIDGLLERLPRTWVADVQIEVPVGASRIDALITLSAPDGDQAVLLFEAKTLLEARDINRVLEQTLRLIERLGRPATPVLAARYLSPRVQEMLIEADVSYADATGNLRLTIDRPALFLRDVGARQDPWRGRGRPRGTLKGQTAARLVRTLVDYRPPYSLPELATRSGVSVGATYRMIDFLEREALVVRRPRGPIVSVEWRLLLKRWSDEFRANAPVLKPYLEPRGLQALRTRLEDEAEGEYVLTGSLAAEYYAPYAPARLGMLYAKDPAGLASRLGLREVEQGANVLLGAPVDDVVFERTRAVGGVRIASPSQTVVDLLTGPGRGPAEAEAVLAWMEADESAWRE